MNTHREEGASERLVSFVIPAHNEEESLPRLLDELRTVARGLDRPYEIVVVDDGSTDGTGPWLRGHATEHDDLMVLTSRRNRGQSAAMARGLLSARGSVLVTLDADLQNDPADVPRLLERLEGCDLACGVRVNRRDTFTKRIGSRIGNGVRRLVLRDTFRDVGCTLKAWRRPVARAVPKFHGFHRFIPLLARGQGFRVEEEPVNHRTRDYGRTHYGNLGRAFRGLYDLLGMAWLLRRRVVLADDPPESEDAPR
jgi:glycosyltransferase involved in cell wall biosynthesis